MIEAFQMPEEYISPEGFSLISARELHAAIGGSTNFSTWFKRRVAKLGIVEGVEYMARKLSTSSKGSRRPQMDYGIQPDAVSEMVFLERGSKLARVCRYFVDTEKRYISLLVDQAHTAKVTRSMMLN